MRLAIQHEKKNTGKQKTKQEKGVISSLPVSLGEGRDIACIRWKVSEVEESDKQIKKVSEGEGDKVDRGRKENKGIKVL